MSHLLILISISGNVHSALQMTDEFLAIFPSHQRAMKNRAYYKAAIEQNALPLNTQNKVTGNKVVTVCFTFMYV